MNCPDCGTFFVPGESGPMQQEGCPNCGRPYAHQPTPLHSEMEMRNMPAPGESDMGGNPLKEGILADNGWNGTMKRDEYFASLRQAATPVGAIPCVSCNGVPGNHNCPDCGGEGEVWTTRNGEGMTTPGAPSYGGEPNTMPDQIYPPGVGTSHLDQPYPRNWPEQSPPIPAHIPRHQGSDVTYLDKDAIARWDRSTLSQRAYMPWTAAVEEPDFEIEAVLPPDEDAVKDRALKKVIREGGIFGDAWNGIKDVGQYAWHHPLVAGGILGAMAVPVVGPGLAAGLGMGAAGAGAAEAGLAAEEAGAGVAADAAAGAGAASATSALPVAFNGAGAAGEAAGAGATAARAGLAARAGNWMNGALRAAPGKALKTMGMGEAVNMGEQALMGGQPGGGMQGAPPPRSFEQISRVADYESPGSHGEIPKNVDGDSNQKSDGDNSSWQKDYAETDGGGATQSPHQMDATFSPETQSAFEEMFPLVLSYYQSDQSGADDPQIQALHELLEGEIPGYRDHADYDLKDDVPSAGHDPRGDTHEPGEAAFNDPTQENKKDDNTDNTDGRLTQGRVAVQESMPLAPGPGGANPGLGMPSPTQAVPQMTGPSAMANKCINGHIVDPSSVQCPQCGAPVAHLPSSMASVPDTAFQYEQSDIPEALTLSEYRHNLGPRQDVMCPNCEQPYNATFDVCPHCNLPQHVGADHQGPHTPEQIQAVQMLLHAEGRPLEDIFDVPVKPWAYAQDLAKIQQDPNVPQVTADQPPPQPPPPMPGPPDGQPPPPGGGMPVPPMSAPPMSPVSSIHWSVDSIGATCPNCGGHTTGLVTQDGDTHCHSCGHIFKTEVMADDGKSTDMSATAAQHEHVNPMGVPAADQHQPYDAEHDRDSSLTWRDTSGRPLRVGESYEMHSLNSDIPSVVQINEVKPNGVMVTEVGEYGLNYQHEIRPEEASMYQYEFNPAGETKGLMDQPDLEENNDAQPTDTGFEQTDMSAAPNTQERGLTAAAAPMGAPPNPSSIPTPMTSTPQGAAPTDTAQQTCPTCGGPMIGGQCPNCASQQYGTAVGGQPGMGQTAQPVGVGQPMGQMAHVNPDLAWLDDDGAITKSAGYRYSPGEEREFVDEQGTARNADRLDLTHTHYEGGFERDLEDEFLW